MKTEVTVLPGDQQTLVTVLEGKALEQRPPNAIRISGDINSVAAYIKKRRLALATEDKGDLQVLSVGNFQIIDIDRSVITVDMFEQNITLQVDPQDHYGVVVIGQLDDSDELKDFKINKEFEWNKADLVKLIRFSRRFFDSPDKHAELLQSYQVFNAKVYADLLQADDGRGNLHNSYKQTVKTSIPEDFVLKMPIFKGQPEEKFRVNIYIRVADAGARFWFESVELEELIEKRVKEIMSEQLKDCSDFVVIYK